MELFTIQIKTHIGWVWGSEFYGLDIATGVVGGWYTGSQERAVDEAKELAKIRVPGTTRVMRVVMDDEPFLLL